MKKHFGTRRPRLLRSLVSVVAVVLVAFGLPLVTMSAASAHIPAYSASCGGVSVSGTYYSSYETNILKIQIDNATPVQKTFGTAGELSVAVPQNDGLVHSWHVWVITPNPAYRLDQSGTVGPCGTKHVTAVLWETSPPTCDADGALVPKAEPEGITVTRDPASGTGPGTYTITFTAKPGFAIDGATSLQLVVLPRLTGDQCATVVQPVTPTFTNPTCTGPGTGTPGSITLPADGGGITYSKSDALVTATADATHKFVTLPTGWTLVDAHHATYAVTYTDPSGYPDCLVEVSAPTPPAATAPTCSTDGSLTVAPTQHVVTTVDESVIEGETSFGPGQHTIVYTPAEGYTFGEATVEPAVVTVLPATHDCPTSVVSPTVTQSVCTGPGTHSDPVVKLGDVEGDHVSYVYDAASHVVTASPDFGFALADLPTGWTLQENRTATYTVVLTDPGPCLVTVVSPPTTSPTVQVNAPTHHPAMLPNTGGPNAWLALGGLALLLGGGALLVRERRLR